MSHFGFYEKDNVVEAIESLAQAEYERGKTPREIIQSILDATSYGLDEALYELRKVPVDNN